MKNILIVNDDGITAKGIQLLHDVTKKYANCYVVAPLSVRSGMSQAITIRGFFDVKKYNSQKYGLSGTPADCTLYGFHIFDVKFDYVFSGVNDGPNLGRDIFHSGTVGAASEGAFKNIQTFAFSCGRKNNWDNVIKHLDEVIQSIIKGDHTALVTNINFPRDGMMVKGYKYTKQGNRNYIVNFHTKGDKLFNTHDVQPEYTVEGTDIYETREGYITFTPLNLDRTDYEYLKKL